MDRRDDYGTPADPFFVSLKEPVATLARDLRSLIREAVPGATEAIKWGMPVYEKSEIICGIRPARDYVALQFYAGGTQLNDPDGLLEGTGKKMRHVKIRSRTDIRRRLFASWLGELASDSRSGVATSSGPCHDGCD